MSDPEKGKASRKNLQKAKGTSPRPLISGGPVTGRGDRSRSSETPLQGVAFRVSGPLVHRPGNHEIGCPILRGPREQVFVRGVDPRDDFVFVARVGLHESQQAVSRVPRSLAFGAREGITRLIPPHEIHNPRSVSVSSPPFPTPPLASRSPSLYYQSCLSGG